MQIQLLGKIMFCISLIFCNYFTAYAQGRTQIPIASVTILDLTLKNKPLACFGSTTKAKIVLVLKSKVNTKGETVYLTRALSRNEKRKNNLYTLALENCNSKRNPDSEPTPSPTENDPTQPAGPYAFMQRPFEQDFPLTNFFDHNLPFQFEDTNGFQLIHSGESSQLGIDGHEGHDWAMPEGTSLKAVANGTVTYAGTEDPFYCPLLSKTVAGNLVTVQHTLANGEIYRSVYLHLSVIKVSIGDTVSAGQEIGFSGNTGCSSGPHLHFHIVRATNTNSNKSTRVDPFGWSALTEDPWKVHTQGAASEYLWLSGKEPPLYRESTDLPNPGTGDSAPVAITKFRLMGVNDNLLPNNEFLQLELDSRFASTNYSIAGFQIKNNSNQSFTIPEGTKLLTGTPIKFYTGSGTNTQTEIYMGKTTEFWSNNGDCARLVRPSGSTMYTYRYGVSQCSQSVANFVESETVVSVSDKEIRELSSSK